MMTLDDFDNLEEALKEQKEINAKINNLFESVKNKIILEILSYKGNSNIEVFNSFELLANASNLEYYNIDSQLYRIVNFLERCKDIESLKRDISVCIYKEYVEDEKIIVKLNPKVIEILKNIQRKLSRF